MQSVAAETQSVASIAPDDFDEFNWADENNCIALQPQDETAFYWNAHESLVIRQHHWPDEDHYIVVTKQSLSDFLDKLVDFCGVPSAP